MTQCAPCRFVPPNFSQAENIKVTDTHQTPANDQEEVRLPRVALMGEFSAGKSTLTNLLLAADPLPVKITATRLPPVWITYGTGHGLREDTQGNVHPLGNEGLANVVLEDTRLIQLQMQSDILQMCDLVDMPGISDPNMDSAVWRNVIAEADIVVWCTHATQAWRQSEAAAFDSLPDVLKKKAILLVTRFDKLTTDRDRRRVLARVKTETRDRFLSVFPVSLLDALSSGDDRGRWEKSGAEPFIQSLLELLVAPEPPQDSEPAGIAAEPENGASPAITPVRPARVIPKQAQTQRPAASTRPGMSGTTERHA